MKKLFIAAVVTTLLAISVAAQSGVQYVAAKSGLSMRETPAASAKVVEKIPYGTKVSIIEEDGDWKEIITEGLTGYWRKVKFNNKTGYIVDSYLLPWPPPKINTTKYLKQYLTQVTTFFGQKLVIKSGKEVQLTESGWELHKQLYKNGAGYHEFFGYEYGSDTYFLPGFSLQQGFLLCRLLDEFSEVFGEKGEFPTANKKFKKGEREYDIQLLKRNTEEEYGGPSTIEKIKIFYEDGAYYQFEMYLHDGQLVIFFSGGV